LMWKIDLMFGIDISPRARATVIDQTYTATNTKP
jgi:hypothetical protein